MALECGELQNQPDPSHLTSMGKALDINQYHKRYVTIRTVLIQESYQLFQELIVLIFSNALQL